MTIAAAGFRQFEALGLAESVHSGSSGSSTHAPAGSCLTLQPATIRCLRRMLNRPVESQVNAFSELIWCIMKLCRQRDQQSAFCQYARAQPADLQALLDWASDHLEAEFEGLPVSVSRCDARALIAHWESHAPVTCTEYSLTTAVDTSGGSGSSSQQAADQAAAVAHAAMGVIRGFFTVWQPHPAQPQDGTAARRKLAFGSSRAGPATAAPASPLLSTGQCRKDQPVAWVYSPEADIAPGARAQPRPPRCGDELDIDDAAAAAAAAPGCSSTAAAAAERQPLPQASRASAHSVHKSQGSAASAGAAPGRHPAEASLDQDLEAASVAAPPSDLEDSLSVYLARQQELRPLPERAARAGPGGGRALPTPPSPQTRRPSRVMSAIRSLVLPSCMRQLALAGGQQQQQQQFPAQHRGRPRQHRPHQYGVAKAGAMAPSASQASVTASDRSHGLQRSRSFERWIRQQAPATPSPSFTVRVSHSSSSDTTAARTAQWVIDAVQQAADRLSLEAAAAEGVSDPSGALLLADAQPAQPSAENSRADCSKPATETAFPTTDASGPTVDSWTSWGTQQRAAAAAGVCHIPQHAEPETAAPSASTPASSVSSADLTTVSEHVTLGSEGAPAMRRRSAEAPAAAVARSLLDPDLPATSSLQASPAPLTRSDFPPSPMFPSSPILTNLAPVAVPPPEIMDPVTPSTSASRTRPASPSMRLLRRSVGSWASDTPSAAPPADTSPPDHVHSPFGNNAPSVPPAASWASTVSPHNSVSGTPHRPPSPIPALALASVEDPIAAHPISPISGSQYAGLRRDSWSSDYSNPSPVQSRATDTVFAQYQHQHQPAPHTHHQVLPVPTGGLASMRSMPQVPSRLGSRRNHLSRAGSARSATIAAATAAAAAAPAPLTDVIDDTGDSAAAPGSGSGGEDAAAVEPTQSRNLDIDTHFFSDRGATITGSTDLDTLEALHLQQSAGDIDTLQPALSGISEQQLARAVTLDGLLLAAQQHLSRAASALAALPPPPALASASLSRDGQEQELPAVASSATLPEVPLPSGSGSDQSDGRGGLSGLSVRLALTPQTQSSSSEEEEAPQTLRHFGSFTGSTEPAYLSGGRLPLSRTGACYSVGQAV